MGRGVGGVVVPTRNPGSLFLEEPAEKRLQLLLVCSPQASWVKLPSILTYGRRPEFRVWGSRAYPPLLPPRCVLVGEMLWLPKLPGATSPGLAPGLFLGHRSRVEAGCTALGQEAGSEATQELIQRARD